MEIDEHTTTSTEEVKFIRGAYRGIPVKFIRENENGKYKYRLELDEVTNNAERKLSMTELSN